MPPFTDNAHSLKDILENFLQLRSLDAFYEPEKIK